MSIPKRDEFLESLYDMCRSARQQLEDAEAAGDPVHIASWLAIVAQCEEVIVQAGGRRNA